MKRNALITGANSGIGLAAAEALAKRGYRIHAGVRTEQNAEAMRRRGFEPVIIDVRNEALMRDGVASIEQKAGSIDVLVNSAGYGITGPMEELEMDVLREQFEVNVFGLLRMSQLVLPGMRWRRSGRIIHIGSVGGLMTTPGAGAYHMSKYAVESLTDAMRAEVRGFGVHVAVIEPTGVATNFVGRQVATMPPDTADGAYREFKQAWIKMATGLFEGRGSTTVSAEKVAAAIVHAATADKPKTRYPVGAVSHLLPRFRRLVSDRRWDSAMLSQIKVTPGAPAKARRTQPLNSSSGTIR